MLCTIYMCMTAHSFKFLTQVNQKVIANPEQSDSECLLNHECLIICCLRLVPRLFHWNRERHHSKWWYEKFRTLFGADGLWVEEGSYFATPAVRKIPKIQPNPFCGFIRRTYQSVSIFQRCGTGKKLNTESIIEAYEIYLDYNRSQELWNIYRHIKRVYIFRIEYDLSFWLQKLIKPAVVPENFPPENGPGFNPLTEKRAGIHVECPSRNIPV